MCLQKIMDAWPWIAESSLRLFGCKTTECLMSRMLIGAWLYLVVVFIQSSFFAAPYGKFTESHKTPGFVQRLMVAQMPAGLGWFVQEVPAFVVGFTGILHLYKNNEVNLMLVMVPFVLHYFNRSFIYPLSIKQGRAVPVLTVFFAVIFCLWNGVLQTLYVLSNNPLFHSELLMYVGLVLFCTGMFINKQSDYILANLRKPGETGYKIPIGGMFKFVSAPNYLGEIMEWTGWFFMNPNHASLWFCLFTVAFLGTRALHTHAFYQAKFKEEYPADRKAVIPGLI